MNDFHSRHVGLFDPSVLAEKRVLVIGCGSLGSELASRLTRSGVRRFTLIDPDTVAPTNICRTAYLARDLGRPKVEALAEHLKAIAGGLEIEAHARSLTEVDDRTLTEWIAGADLVVAVTDHPPTQARLGALSYHHTPALFAGVYVKGTGGEVLWTLPDLTPCYACVLGALRGANAPPRGKTDYGLSTGQLAAEPALGIDVLHVTVCAAKIALALLLRGSGSSLESLVNPEQSVLFVGNAVDWIWTEPFQTVWARADRRTRCICRLRPQDSTADLLDELPAE